MAVPFQDVFLGLLTAYSAYSLYAHLNPRYLVYGALLLLFGAAAADWTGATVAANNLALDVLFTLAAGVTLLAVDLRRGPRSRASGSLASDPPSPDAAQPGEAPPEHPLHDLQGEAVPVVDAPRPQDDHHEQTRDPESEKR